MHHLIIILSSLAIFSLSSAAPRPETVGAGGTCEPPDVEVQGAVKFKDGPYLVTGARVDANPNGGKFLQETLHVQNSLSSRFFSAGGASFTQLYSVTITKEGGAGLDLDS